MKTLYFYHPDCTLHDMGAGHPESPRRLQAIDAALAHSPLLARLEKHQAPAIDKTHLSLAHSTDHINHLFMASPSEGLVSIDPDTSMNCHSLQAALRAAGAGVEAVRRISLGEAKRAFCAVRPPGHHAERHRAMGFCFFNNIAIAALYALNKCDFNRVAILDFDVHHGNGTEDIIRNDARILLCSSFQHPFYPYSGADTKSEHIVNVPLTAGATGAQCRQALKDHWYPAVERHRPELIFISAGFDGHRDDLLANLNLTEEDYYLITADICSLAERYSDGRVISMLEGGYNLDALAASVEAHLSALS